MNIIFGPILSRRFGKSLGVDLSPSKKQCNFDCLYCELKPSVTMSEYGDVVSVDEVVNAIKEALDTHPNIDFLTITANGEPTLYPHLRELMQEINSFKGDIKTLILSNSSTIYKREIQETLMLFDVVKLSLDCATQKCFQKIDRSLNISVEDIKKGILEFNKKYKGELNIEILFVKGVNDKESEIKVLNDYLRKLNVNRIDISTIDRPPAYNVLPLSYKELVDISLQFDKSLPINIAYKPKESDSKFDYSKEDILHTLSLRPLTKDNINALFSKSAKRNLQELLDGNMVKFDKGYFVKGEG